jgi:F0F1-type ATP synthase delta subunit
MKVWNKKLQKQIMAKTGAARINFIVNPHLTTGARITHGDWVWDETLDSKLEQIVNVTM